MPYKRFVEVGRVALISYGPDVGKLCTIVNVLDHNRVLVDGPEPITGVHRHELNVKRIMLTDLTVPVTLNATQKCARSRKRRALHQRAVSSAAAISNMLGSLCVQATSDQMEQGGRPCEVGEQQLGQKAARPRRARDDHRFRAIRDHARPQGAVGCSQGKARVSCVRSRETDDNGYQAPLGSKSEQISSRARRFTHTPNPRVLHAAGPRVVLL